MIKYPPPVTDRRIRFALAGCGRIAANHFGALEKHKERAELVAVCDVEAAALEKAARQTRARPFASYVEMLEKSDADVVVWDPERIVPYGVDAAQHRTDYNLYEGWELKGFPVKVYLRGTLIVDDGRWLGRAGMGRFLHRQAGASAI